MFQLDALILLKARSILFGPKGGGGGGGGVKVIKEECMGGGGGDRYTNTL